MDEIDALKNEVSRLTAELSEANATNLGIKNHSASVLVENNRLRKELAELRSQEPVFWVREEVVKLSMRGVRFGGERTSPRKDEKDGLIFPVFIRPVPAVQEVPDENFRYKFRDRASLEASISSGGLNQLAAATQPPADQVHAATPNDEAILFEAEAKRSRP